MLIINMYLKSHEKFQITVCFGFKFKVKKLFPVLFPKHDFFSY